LQVRALPLQSVHFFPHYFCITKGETTMSRLFVALFVSALVACGGSSKYDQQQTQVAITPKGSIVGRVTEYSSANPLEGVSVTAVIAGTPASATTNADGLYEIKDVVVSSSTTLIFQKDGYLRMFSNSSVPSGAGNSPLAAGYSTLNVRMARGDGEVKGLLRLPNGTPAVGAIVYVDQRNNSFDSVVTATTDMAGAFSLKGLATSPTGINHTIYAQWFDENADGQADYSPTNTSVALYSSGNFARVFLTYNSIGQQVLASNAFDGDLTATDEIKLSFALPVRPSGFNGTVTRQFVLTNSTRGNVDVAVEQTWASPTEVSIKPTSGLREGDVYALAISVQNTNGSSFSRSMSFQVRPTMVTGPATAVTNVTVINDGTYPDRSKFDYSATSFVVSWDVQPTIRTYWIYAKDTGANQAWVLVGNTTLAPGAGRATYNIGLPNSFNNNQPLSAGNKVSFAVVPVDGFGNAGALSSAATVVIADNVSPATQNGGVSSPTGNADDIDAINDTSTAKQVQLRLTYTEPMDPSVAPVFTTTGSATPVTQSFAWEQGNTSGLLSITVPAGGDLSGSFVIRGGKDASGNAVSGADFTGFLGGRKELVVNGGFEDAAGACVLTGWTPAVTGTMAQPTSVAGAGVSETGRCGALIGAPIGAAPQTGTAKLSQDIALPNLTMTPWYFDVRMQARPQYFAPTLPAAVPQTCKITDTFDVLIWSLASWNSTSTSAYQSLSKTPFTPATAGQTIRIVCEVNNSVAMAAAVNAALYIDDVSVSLVKPTSLNN